MHDMRDTDNLTPDNLMDRARAGTGLADFGPDHFLEPLTVLTRAMRDEAQLNAQGLATHSARLVNALENRLRRIELLKRHPEICEEEVDVGVVIVGLPRTGSTMLQRLLAASPKATATLWWETIYPLPRGQANAADVAERKADAEALARQLVDSSAGFEAIHPLDAHAYDEELSLIEQSFVSNNPESMLYLPSYGKWLLDADQRPAYAELLEWLRILQWQDPARRGSKWVLKCPHHLTAVQTVLDVFPNAVMAMTHRRVEHVMGSWYSMVGSLTGGNTDADLAKEQAAHWTARLRRNLVDMLAAREDAEKRFVDVHYRSLLEDPLGNARAVFEAAGITPDAADEAAWSRWLAGNKRDNRPSHKYDVADFGIDADSLAGDFAFYSERFDPTGGK
ncbi:MAG: sulfotransferase [Novosphingobium sp.]